jgi:transposase
MIRPSKATQAYLYTGIVDMRKSIDGLAALVENNLELDPMQDAVFVFCNRGRDKIKILYWERNGFVLWYKRLEKQKFKWLKDISVSSHRISGHELNELLDGLNIFNGKPHKPLFYKNLS